MKKTNGIQIVQGDYFSAMVVFTNAPVDGPFNPLLMLKFKILPYSKTYVSLSQSGGTVTIENTTSLWSPAPSVTINGAKYSQNGDEVLMQLPITRVTEDADWYVNIPAILTDIMVPGQYKYDITAQLTSSLGTVNTPIYSNLFEILPRNNRFVRP